MPININLVSLSQRSPSHNLKGLLVRIILKQIGQLIGKKSYTNIVIHT